MDHFNDPTPHIAITPEQAMDVLQTVTEGVVEFMRCYDSPESRRLINALQTANSMVRVTQQGPCQREGGGFEEDTFDEAREEG